MGCGKLITPVRIASPYVSLFVTSGPGSVRKHAYMQGRGGEEREGERDSDKNIKVQMCVCVCR